MKIRRPFAPALIGSGALALAVLWALPSQAGPLAPRRASELVTLTSSTLCDGGEGRRYDTRIRADGTAALFDIPEKRVLVVTGWSFTFSNGAAGSSSTVWLQVEGVPGFPTLALTEVTFSSSGRGGATLPVRGVVRSGEVLCGSHNGPGTVSSGFGIVEGFLAKDR